MTTANLDVAGAHNRETQANVPFDRFTKRKFVGHWMRSFIAVRETNWLDFNEPEEGSGDRK